MTPDETVLSSAGAPPAGGLWRALTVAMAAAGVAVGLALQRESNRPEMVATHALALRRACLSFPLPMLLRGRREWRYHDAASGTQTLSYRVTAAVCPVDAVYAYYDDYLTRNGFSRSQEWDTYLERIHRVRNWRERMREGTAGPAATWQEERRQRWLADHRDTVVYTHADGLRCASVSVQSEPLRGEHRSVVVTVRPIPL